MLKVFNVLFLFFVLLMTLFSYYYTSQGHRPKNALVTNKVPILIFILIIIIYSTRDLGLDLENYKRFYYDANILGAFNDSSFDYEFELGWKAVIFFLRSFIR